MKLKVLIEYALKDSSLRPKFVEWQGDYCVAGRDSNDLLLQDPQCTKHEVVFYQTPEGNLRVREVESSHGMIVDGKRVQDCEVRVGIEIVVGQKTTLGIISFIPTEAAVKIAAKGKTPPPVSADSIEYVDARGTRATLSLRDLHPTGKKAA